MKKTVPSIEEIEADAFGFEFTVYMNTERSEEELTQVALHVSEIEKVEVKQEQPVAGAQAEKEAKQSATSSSRLANKGTSSKGNAKGKNTKVENRSIRVQLEKIERLMNMFEESVIERGRIDELAEKIQNKELIEHLNRLGDISKDIQNVLLNMRMVPIETVFNRFPRMVRMLAKDLGKKLIYRLRVKIQKSIRLSLMRLEIRLFI